MRGPLNLFAGFAFLAALGYYIFMLMTAEARVSRVCGNIKPGMPVAELRDYLDTAGMGPPLPLSDGVRYAAETKTFGRYACRIELAGGAVRLSTFERAN